MTKSFNIHDWQAKQRLAENDEYQKRQDRLTPGKNPDEFYGKDSVFTKLKDDPNFVRKLNDKNTKKEIDRLDKNRKKDEVADKDRMHKMDQERLFQAKIDAFEMDVIRNTSNRDMKSKIRRSKSIMELTAYVGAIIALESMNGKPATD